MLRFVPFVLVCLSFPAGATTFFSVQNEALVNHSVGPDGLWGTADDGIDPTFNSQGHANQSTIFDVNGEIVGGGAGEYVAELANQTFPNEPGLFTDVSLITTDFDFGTTNVDDPSVTPHQQNVLPDNTYEYGFTFVACLGAPGCADPLTVLSISGAGIYWTVDEDPTAVDAITMSAFGDLSSYALLIESLAPSDATAYAIDIGLVPLTPDNTSGSLVEETWFGGNLFFSQALYSTDPLSEPGPSPIPEPATALLLSLGLLGLAARGRAD